MSKAKSLGDLEKSSNDFLFCNIKKTQKFMWNPFKRQKRYIYDVCFGHYGNEQKIEIPRNRIKDYTDKNAINYWYVTPIESKKSLIKDSIIVFNIDIPKDCEYDYWTIGEVFYFHPDYRWLKGSYYLFRNSENKLRIAKCISVDKLGTLPPIFDGSETPGIGYECLGILIGKY